MNQSELLANRFEERRARLRAVAYRMLGSSAEADDAVQETWLRLHRTDGGAVDNLDAWLTTVTARICLNMLRSRRTRREESLEAVMPDPVVVAAGQLQPEEEAVLADSVGLALLVVLDTLAPAERLAFVLHDMFEVPFDEIAKMVGRTPEAARQLASRARRRVRGAHLHDHSSDPEQQRAVVDAFFRAARDGDFDALVATLDPEVVLRADFSPRNVSASRVIRGASGVADAARIGARPDSVLHAVVVNGEPGAVVTHRGRPIALMSFVVSGTRIIEIDVFGDPQRVTRIATGVLVSARSAS
jgi:RNA polymerase sigma-70 factor (ECF subfamily)